MFCVNPACDHKTFSERFDFSQRHIASTLRVSRNTVAKSFIANALGVNACQYGYKTRYIRLPELFSELEAARIQGKRK